MNEPVAPARTAPVCGFVRCLGPCKVEHHFWSTDVKGRRVCKRGEKKLAAIRVSRLESPLPDPEGRS